MSGKVWEVLRRQMAEGDFEQATLTVETGLAQQQSGFGDCLQAVQHAIHAQQPDLAATLLERGRSFSITVDDKAFREALPELTAILAACWRGKQQKPARAAVALFLECLGKARCQANPDLNPLVVQLAGWAGRFALRQNDIAWFREIIMETAGWLVRGGQSSFGRIFLPVFDSWLHRVLRQNLAEAIPVIFEALSVLFTAESDKKEFAEMFLTEWRVVAATAGLNPESEMASLLVEHLLLFLIRSGESELWQPVITKIGEAASLAVATHGMSAAFPVYRPLLDVVRIQLGDELKFGTGPDPDSVRQKVIRMVCAQTLKIADMAAHSDLASVSGDKIEEIYRVWAGDLRYQSQIRSIIRYCQVLLIYWSNNRKRAARKWTPRESMLSAPLLLTEEDQAKLAFLL